MGRSFWSATYTFLQQLQGWHLGIYLGKNIGGKTWGKTGKKGFEKLGKNWEKPGETGKNLKNCFKTFVSTDNAKLLM